MTAKWKTSLPFKTEITLAVVDALKVKLLNTDKRALLKRYTPDVKAYEYLLRGNYYF